MDGDDRHPRRGTRLSHGDVAALGQGAGGGGTGYRWCPLSSAELYDSASGTWTATCNLGTGRSFHTATLLPSGQVLVAGGLDSSGVLSSAELYDPVAGSWSSTGPFGTARDFHTATLLPSGQVLVVGGTSDGINGLSSAELYDPASGTWTATGSFSTARFVHTATLLPSGKVLVAAGQNSSGYLSSAQLYDPSDPGPGSWSSTGLLGTEHALTRRRCCPRARCWWREDKGQVALSCMIRPLVRGQRPAAWAPRFRTHGDAAGQWQGAGGGWDQR